MVAPTGMVGVVSNIAKPRTSPPLATSRNEPLLIASFPRLSISSTKPVRAKFRGRIDTPGSSLSGNTRAGSEAHESASTIVRIGACEGPSSWKRTGPDE
jgi:hypothetical protein